MRELAAGPVTLGLWDAAAPMLAAIHGHPFLAGLGDGSLPREAFCHFVLQDAHYLRGFGRALAMLAARAADDDALVTLCAQAAGAVEVERALHAGFVADLGLTLAEAAAAPVGCATLGYTATLLAAASTAPWAEGMAAVLPCYWVYADVGAALLVAGSPDPLYQRWIETYAGDIYVGLVRAAVELTERACAGLPSAALAAVADRFAASIRWEWVFWDAAWCQELWPGPPRCRDPRPTSP